MRHIAAKISNVLHVCSCQRTRHLQNCLRKQVESAHAADACTPQLTANMAAVCRQSVPC